VWILALTMGNSAALGAVASEDCASNFAPMSLQSKRPADAYSAEGERAGLPRYCLRKSLCAGSSFATVVSVLALKVTPQIDFTSFWAD
jgi:hypothetical protein